MATNGVPIPSVVLTEADDDAAGVTVTPPAFAVPEGERGSYTVLLTRQPSGPVTVTGDPAGRERQVLSVTPPALTFTTDDWSRAQTFWVDATADADRLDGTATIRAPLPSAGASARSPSPR